MNLHNTFFSNTYLISEITPIGLFTGHRSFTGLCTDAGFVCNAPFNRTFTAIFECESDIQCPGTYKCCNQNCFEHKICVKRSVAPIETDDGTCEKWPYNCHYPYPYIFSHRFRCEYDKQCPKNFKCCQQNCFLHKICSRKVNADGKLPKTSENTRNARVNISPDLEPPAEIRSYNTKDTDGNWTPEAIEEIRSTTVENRALTTTTKKSSWFNIFDTNSNTEVKVKEEDTDDKDKADEDEGNDEENSNEETETEKGEDNVVDNADEGEANDDEYANEETAIKNGENNEENDVIKEADTDTKNQDEDEEANRDVEEPVDKLTQNIPIKVVEDSVKSEDGSEERNEEEDNTVTESSENEETTTVTTTTERNPITDIVTVVVVLTPDPNSIESILLQNTSSTLVSNDEKPPSTRNPEYEDYYEHYSEYENENEEMKRRK